MGYPDPASGTNRIACALRRCAVPLLLFLRRERHRLVAFVLAALLIILDHHPRHVAHAVPSSRLTSFTPCVLRPLTRIPLTGMRITTPCLVININSSSGSTSLSATTSLVLYVRLSVMMPVPPRF